MNRVIGNGFNAKQEQYGLDYVFKPVSFPIPEGRDYAIFVSQQLL